MGDASLGLRAGEARSLLLVPKTAVQVTLRGLDLVAGVLISLGVTANAITVTSVVLAAIGGGLLAFGQFAWAGAAMVVSSLGDALDGMVARRSGSASVAGALLDASVDRYEEFLFLGGLAVHFHESTAALLLTVAALAGSFMVSYGSAKAEALGVPVPPGAMRRAERAVCLCAGVVSMPVLSWATHGSAMPFWAANAPLLLMLVVVALGANVSAVRRLRLLAHHGNKATGARIGVTPDALEIEADEADPMSDPDPGGQVVVAPHAP
jgi:CDP-diacylglycerol--glycerol-3-phosphate 3-phosphatidyltransferase